MGILKRIALLAVVVVTVGTPLTGMAFFPPISGGVVGQPVPPDPFPTPGTGGQGDPETPDPGKLPTVETPEPATMVTAAIGVLAAVGYGWRRRRTASAE